MIIIMILLSCSGMERKCHCSHIPGHYKGSRGVLQPPNNYCKGACDSVVLLIKDSSLIFNAFVSLEKTQHPLHCVRLSNPGDLFSHLWLTIKNPGNLYPGSVQSNRLKARVTKIKLLVPSTDPSFYWA